MHVAYTNHLRFFSLFIFQAGRKDRSDALNTAIDRMTKKTRDLRRQVCFIYVMVLHITPVFRLVTGLHVEEKVPGKSQINKL